MPKKTLPRANGSKKRTVSLPPPFIPPLLPTAPLMTEAAVATATANQIALGTLMICCLTLLAAFSSSMMAGIVSLTNTSSASSAPSVRCSDTDLNSQYPTGRNYFVKGEAKGIWSISGTMQDLTDICKKIK